MDTWFGDGGNKNIKSSETNEINIKYKNVSPLGPSSVYNNNNSNHIMNRTDRDQISHAFHHMVFAGVWRFDLCNCHGKLHGYSYRCIPWSDLRHNAFPFYFFPFIFILHYNIRILWQGRGTIDISSQNNDVTISIR